MKWDHKNHGAVHNFTAEIANEKDAINLDAEIWKWLGDVGNHQAQNSLELVRTLNDRWDRMAMQYIWGRKQSFEVRLCFINDDANAIQFKLKFC
jgi:hypothetical protein